MISEFKQGLKDGIPIALGYLSVSFGFGILALKDGLSALEAVITSALNITSAGQLAGIGIIAAGGTLAEMALTQFIINLRYALMSLSLSQKMPSDATVGKRLLIAFANTDEVFAVAMARNKELTVKYILGLQLLPVLGWIAGTAAGAVLSDILPKALCSALSVALYGMFVAIVIPAAKKSRPVAFVAAISLCLSCMLYYVPVFKNVSTGIAVIICTVAASTAGALCFPTYEKDERGTKEEAIK